MFLLVFPLSPLAQRRVSIRLLDFSLRSERTYCLFDHQIITMDDFIVILVAQSLLDVGALSTHDLRDGLRRVVDQPLGDLAACMVHAGDTVAGLEVASDGGDSGRQQALAPPRECLHRAVIEHQLALRLERMRDPVFAARELLLLREEQRADVLPLEKSRELLNTLSTENHRRDAIAG